MDGDEVRRAIDAGDVEGLARLLTAQPALVRARLSWPGNADDRPIAYVSHARFHGLADHDRVGDLARVLLAMGAPVEGEPGDAETPLITAASYGEADVARALLAAGADLEARGFAVPGGTALAHAVQFGNAEVIDVLVAARAQVRSLVEAAGVGDLDGFLDDATPEEERAAALRAAVVCERLETVDRLLATGVPVDVEVDGGTPLHWAGWEGAPEAVAHLLARGADASRKDPEYGLTPLGWSRHRGGEVGTDPRRAEAERLLERA